MRRHFHLLHRRSREHVKRRPYILPILGLLVGAAIVLAAVFLGGVRQAPDYNSHIVDLSVAGKPQTVATRATTVGELIDRLHINLIPQDQVEPTRDTPIVEDNFKVNIYEARPVTVIDGNRRIVTLTAQKSPRVVAQAAGVTVYPEDDVSFASGDLREGILGEKVVIVRSTPVLLNLYGTASTVHAHAATVGGFLAEKKIVLATGDSVQPAPEIPLTPNLQVFVVRQGTQVATVAADIPAPVQYVEDASLSLGTTVVRQPGAAGKKQVTYQITTQNGQQTSRQVIQEIIIQAAVPQIVARGKSVNVSGDKEALMAAGGISSGDYGYVNYIVSRESNWNPGARNSSGCLGLGQACPGSKLTAVCSLDDTVCQLRYFTNYASRYGGWGGSYSFWQSHGYW